MVRKWRQALHTYDPPELQSDAGSANTIKQTAALDAPAQQTPDATASTVDSAAVANNNTDKMDPSRERSTEAAAAPALHDAPRHSIFDNFVEDGDEVADADDDDDDDDLL